jgi:ABC-type nitrate/sulfonate/bicarbonate transport system substrate-binding protein
MRGAITAVFVLCVLSVSAVSAQDRVRYGSAVKLSPVYYLPILAAQEKGMFAKHGVAVEWIPSESGPDMMRNFASATIDMGSSNGGTDIPAISRGVPAIITANLQPRDGFAFWVLTNSRIKTSQDLKGAKLGVSRLSGVEHAYGLLAAKQLGLSNDVSFIGTGGIRESLAILVTGNVDGVILNPQNVIELKLQGKIRELVPIADFLPKPWFSYSITTAKAMVERRPDVVARTQRSLFEANRFIESAEGKPWAMAKMREMNGYSAEGAEEIYATLNLSPDGKIDKAAVRNAINFMTEYGLMKPGEATAIDTVFTDRFVR